MIAYVNLLALFFFTICNGQVTYWTGGASSSNFSDTSNWSNGVPSLTSIVYINETGCSGCVIVIDRSVKVAELHLIAATGSGAQVQIKAGASVNVTKVFNLGSANPTTYYSTSVELSEASQFVLETDCVATIYYSGNYAIRSSDDTDNWFINKGNITVYGNGDLTAGSYDTVYIGDSSYVLNIASYGSWNVTDGNAQLYFDYINEFNIYGGSFKGVEISSSSGYVYPSIYFDTCEVVLQNGSGTDANGAGGVTFEGIVAFNSYYTQYTTGYSSTPPSSLIFNTTGVTVSNALFTGVNILFLYDGWLHDCNITDYSLVNSTVNDVHAYINGTNNLVKDSTFAGINTNFIVQVEVGATITMTSTFSLLGSVTLINNGVWNYYSNDYLYFDAPAYWINLGLLLVTTYYSDYIKGSQFYDGTTFTEVGTMVNMGTIQISNGGGLNFQQGSGKFIQCSNGITKFVFDSTSTPGTVTLPSCIIDGYLGLSFNGVTPTSDTTLFHFVPDTGSLITPVFSGSLSIRTKGEPVTWVSLICYDKSGYVTLYDSISESGTCPQSTESQFLTPKSGGACGDLSPSIKSLEASASCPASVTCGVDTGSGGGNPPSPPTTNPPSAPTGTPTDGGNGTYPSPPPGNSAASFNVSLAFLVSLVCFLLKF